MSSSLVVITGASRGIGLTLVQKYKAEGSTVLAVVRKTTPELAAVGVEVVEGVDFGQDGAIERALTAIGGRIVSILINNAGILSKEKFNELPTASASLEKSFIVNAVAPIQFTQAIAAAGGFAPGSKVAFMSTGAASITKLSNAGNFAVYPYRMSKAALNMGAKLVALELKDAGVAVVIVHPGMVATDMLSDFFTLAPAPAPDAPPASVPKPITTSESAEGIIRVVNALTVETTGSFLVYDGTSLPF